MKKIIVTCFCLIVFIVGCSAGNTAADVVRQYLNKYVTKDDAIMAQLDEYISNEDLTIEQKDIYRTVLKRQYSNLIYKVVSEDYDDNEAIVTVKITVYDLYRAQKNAREYLEVNSMEFNNENDEYDKDLFLDYKLSEMYKYVETVDYTIEFFVTKNDGEWTMQQPSATVLEKIHGIYNYDNK